MEINFCNCSAAEQDKSFLVQQFFKNAAGVEGEYCLKNYVVQRLDLPLLPSSLPAGSETLCATLMAHGEVGEKSDSFSRESEQDRSPL
jgi:hypothetical protein